MTAARKVIVEHPAHRNLVRAARELGKAKLVDGIPDSAIYLIENADSLVRGSIDVLLEPDPLKSELGTIVMFLRESLTRRMEKVEGEMREVYEITDEYLLGKAAQRAFALPRMFTKGDGT